MKKSMQNRIGKKPLSFEKFQISSISKPEKITGGGDGGWTKRKDKDEE